MNLIIPVFAIATAVLALNPMLAGAAAATHRQVEFSGAGKSREVSSQHTWHRHLRIYRWPVYEGPQACSSVLFPRSPLCAHVPVTFSPY
jgi:hypothetical protein